MTYRTDLLRKSLTGFAMAGEALAVAVLFERYPLETLPVRLEVLRYGAVCVWGG